MAIKKNDFVELDYIGSLKESNQIFDITNKEEAKKLKIFNEKAEYGSIKVIIGEKQLVKGLEDFLIGKEPGEYKVELTAEQAFGKKNPKLMRIIPMNAFIKQNIKPFPGLQLNLDGLIGTVRSVSGGRVVMDFNHPIAGRDVVYEVKVKGIITDAKEKVGILIHNLHRDIKFDFKSNVVEIHADVPKQLEEAIEKKIKGLVQEVKEVKFVKPKAEDKKK